MRLQKLGFRKVAAAVALLAVVALASIVGTEASNMAFKMNRAIAAKGAGNIGRNLVALPFRTPIVTAQDVCTALNLTNGNPAATVNQVNPATGVSSTYSCVAGGTGFTLKLYTGITVNNNVATNGIVVGSHAPQPAGTIILEGLGGGNIGNNHFPVLYHTTATTAQNLCDDLALPQPGNATINKINAATGVSDTFVCVPGGVGFGLVLGESVRITFTGADIPLPLGKPSHF